MTAAAVVVDPRRLPVPARKRGPRALVNVSHVWVLHKRVFVRLFAAVICLAAIAGIYQLKDLIATGALTLSDMAQGRFAEAGVAIDNIEITGQTITREQDIFTALGVGAKDFTFSFDAEAARDRVEAIPAVETATVRKIYPDKLVVTITEKVPVARWRVDGVTFVVDAAGEQIGEDRGAYGDLPLVIGDGAADDALVMIRQLDQFPNLQTGLVALSRIGDRRWDMVFDTGLRVQLPETGVAQALVQLTNYERDYQLLERDVTLIDLRVTGLVALKPTVRETETDKKSKTKP